MQDCKAAKAFQSQGLDVMTKESRDLSSAILFRQFIGALIQLANIVRHDIAFAVAYRSRFIHKRTVNLWKAEKHV